MSENCTTQHGYGETGNPGCLPQTGGIDFGIVGVLLIVAAVVVAAFEMARREWMG